MTSKQELEAIGTGPTVLADSGEPAGPAAGAPPAPAGAPSPTRGADGVYPSPGAAAGSPSPYGSGFDRYASTPGAAGPGPAGYGAPPGTGYGAYAPPPAGFGAYGPAPGMPPGYVPFATSATPLAQGVPWEGREGGYGSRWWATVKAVNGNTREFFAAAAESTGGGLPGCTFNMVSQGLFGLAFGLLYLVLFTGLGMAGLFAGLGPRGGLSMAGVGFGIGLVYMLMMAVGQTFGGFVNPWIIGGIHHLLLMLFKGANRNYEHTVRAFAYSNGAAITWALIPLVGVFPAAIFMIKNLVQAYDETHHCGVGKALAVLFAPALCLCACYGVALAMVFGFGAMAGP